MPNLSTHTYTCECLDALLRATICKHIHLVHMTTIDTGRQTDYSYQEPFDEPNYIYFNKILFNDTSKTMDHKTKCLQELKELENRIENRDRDDTIQSVRKHIQAANTVINASGVTMEKSCNQKTKNSTK